MESPAPAPSVAAEAPAPADDGASTKTMTADGAKVVTVVTSPFASTAAPAEPSGAPAVSAALDGTSATPSEVSAKPATTKKLVVLSDVIGKLQGIFNEIAQHTNDAGEKVARVSDFQQRAPPDWMFMLNFTKAAGEDKLLTFDELESHVKESSFTASDLVEAKNRAATKIQSAARGRAGRVRCRSIRQHKQGK